MKFRLIFKKLIAITVITACILPSYAVDAENSADSLRFLYRTDFSEFTKNYPDGVNIKFAEAGKTEQLSAEYPLINPELWSFMHWWNVSKSEVAGFFTDSEGKSYMHLNAYNANGDYIRFKPLDKNPADVKNKLVISEIISYNTAPSNDSSNRWPAGAILNYGSGETGIGGGIVYIRRSDNMMFTWNQSGQSQIAEDNSNIIELGIIGNQPVELAAVIDFNTNSYDIYVDGECKAENVDWMNFSGSFRNFDLYSSGSLNAKLHNFAIYDADGYVSDLTPYGGYAYRETEYAYDLDGSTIVRENGSITVKDYLVVLESEKNFNKESIKIFQDNTFEKELKKNSFLPDKAYIIYTAEDKTEYLYNVVSDITFENEEMKVEIGEFSYYAEAKKNSNGTSEAAVVLGLYDSNGVLKDVEFENILVSDEENYIIDKSYIFTNVNDGDVADVWLVENLTDMTVWSKVRSKTLEVNTLVENSIVIDEASDESIMMFKLDLTDIADETILSSGDMQTLPAPGIVRWGVQNGSAGGGIKVLTDADGDKYLQMFGSGEPSRRIKFGVFGVPNTYDRPISKRYFILEGKFASTSFGNAVITNTEPYLDIMTWSLSGGGSNRLIILDQDKKLKAVDAFGNKIALTDEEFAANGIYNKLTLVFDREADKYTVYLNDEAVREDIPYAFSFSDNKFYSSNVYKFWMEDFKLKDFVAYECDMASFASPEDYATAGEGEDFDIPGYNVSVTLGRRASKNTKLICKYNFDGFSNEVEIPYNMEINDDNTAFECSMFIQSCGEESIEIYMIDPNDSTGNKLVSEIYPAN